MSLSFALLEAFDKQLLEAVQVNHSHIFHHSAAATSAALTHADSFVSYNTTTADAELSLQDVAAPSKHAIRQGSLKEVRGARGAQLQYLSPAASKGVKAAKGPQATRKRSVGAASSHRSSDAPSPSPAPAEAPPVPQPLPVRSVHFAPEMIAAEPITLDVPSHRAASPVKSALKSPRPLPAEGDGVLQTSEPSPVDGARPGTAPSASPEPAMPLSSVTSSENLLLAGANTKSPWDRLTSQTPQQLARMQQLVKDREKAFKSAHSFSPKTSWRKPASKKAAEPEPLRQRRASMFGKEGDGIGLTASLSDAAGDNDSAPFHRDPLLETAGGFDDERLGSDNSSAGQQTLYDDILDDVDVIGPRTPLNMQRRKSSRNNNASSGLLDRHSGAASSSRRLSTGGDGGARPRRLDSSMYSTTSSFYQPPPTEYPESLPSFVGDKAARRLESPRSARKSSTHSYQSNLRTPLGRSATEGDSAWNTTAQQQQQQLGRKETQHDLQLSALFPHHRPADSANASRKGSAFEATSVSLSERRGLQQLNMSPGSSPATTPRHSPRNGIALASSRNQRNEDARRRKRDSGAIPPSAAKLVSGDKAATLRKDSHITIATGTEVDGKQRLLSDLFVWEAQRKERLFHLAAKVQQERNDAASKQDAAFHKSAPVTMSQGSKWIVASMHDRRISAVDHSQMVSAAKARDVKKAAMEKMVRESLDVGKQHSSSQILSPHVTTSANDIGSTSRRCAVGASASIDGGAAGLGWWMSRALDDAAYARNR